MEISPTRADYKKYTDHGDLFVTGKDGIERRREVKWLSFDFNCHEWPWPDYIICAVDRYEINGEKPEVIVAFSGDMSHMGMVRPAGEGDWFVSLRGNKKMEGVPPREHYVCYPRYVRFQRVPDFETIQSK